jgi:single-strand DNA-binding protein
MASVNRVTLIGNCGNAPEVRVMPNGDMVANFSIATTDVWKDKSGQKQERTEWHRIVAYRKLAEIVESYVKKGSSIYIEGHIQSSEYETKEGQKRTNYNIIVEQLRLLGGKPDSEPDQERIKEPAKTNSVGFDDFEQNIPFN